jgi:hypothetical protein
MISGNARRASARGRQKSHFRGSFKFRGSGRLTTRIAGPGPGPAPETASQTVTTGRTRTLMMTVIMIMITSCPSRESLLSTACPSLPPTGTGSQRL